MSHTVTGQQVEVSGTQKFRIANLHAITKTDRQRLQKRSERGQEIGELGEGRAAERAELEDQGRDLRWR